MYCTQCLLSFTIRCIVFDGFVWHVHTRMCVCVCVRGIGVFGNASLGFDFLNLPACQEFPPRATQVFKRDMYSLGVVVHLLLVGKLPYRDGASSRDWLSLPIWVPEYLAHLEHSNTDIENGTVPKKIRPLSTHC